MKLKDLEAYGKGIHPLINATGIKLETKRKAFKLSKWITDVKEEVKAVLENNKDDQNINDMMFDNPEVTFTEEELLEIDDLTPAMISDLAIINLVE